MLPLWFFVFIVVVVRMLRMDFNQKSSGCEVVILLLIVLYYMESRQVSPYLYMVSVLLGIWRLLMIPAFGEILRQWYAKVSASPPLSTVTTAYNASAARGKQISGQLRHLYRQAGTEALLEFNGSSTSAEPPQKSPTIRERCMRDRVGKSRLRLASDLPPSPEG